MAHSLSAYFLLTLALVGTTQGANELHLRNGDRITGDLVNRLGGKIYFESKVLGRLVVDETEGVVVDMPDTPVESLVGLPPRRAEKKPAAASPAPATPTPASSASGPSQPATSQARITRSPGAGSPARPVKTPWRGKIEFGYQQQSGRNDTVNISLRADAEKKTGADSFKGSGRLLYGEQNDRANSDRYDASFRWRHELNARFFGQTLTSYTADKIKGIDHNYEQNVGAGYRLLNHARHAANMGIGATGQYREAFGVNEGTTLLGEIFQDYAYKFNGRLSLLQEANLLYSPEGRGTFTVVGNSVTKSNVEADNYRLRFNSTLQGRVTERVSLNLRYEYEFDNAISNAAAKTDQRVTSSVGYAF